MDLDVHLTAEMQCQSGILPSKTAFSHLFSIPLLCHLQCCRGTLELRLFCACPPVPPQERVIKQDSRFSTESNLVPLGNRESPTCPDTFGDLFSFYSGKPQTQELPGLTGLSARAAQAHLLSEAGLNTRPSAGNSQQIPCPHIPSERDTYSASSFFCLSLSVLRVQLYASI